MFVAIGFAKAGPKPSQVTRTAARNNNHCAHSTPCAKATTAANKVPQGTCFIQPLQITVCAPG